MLSSREILLAPELFAAMALALIEAEAEAGAHQGVESHQVLRI